MAEAAYRFYKTKCEEESTKRRGKEDSIKMIKRRHERIVRVSTVLTVFRPQLYNSPD